MSNTNLRDAKKKKNDEFYTRIEDVERELVHYDFTGKWVYSPSDDYRESKFTEYFVTNFSDLGLTHYTCTNYDLGYGAYRFDYDGENTTVTPLEGNGDFASDECRQIMKECDIVVTNPPFSLFRPFVAQIMEFNKKFLIIGNKNAITYKEIFPLIKDNKMWLGFTVPEDFEQPEGFEKKSLKGLTRWFTNLVHSKRLDGIYCPARYKGREDKYPVYDNYDAIEIGHYTRNGKWEGSLDELPSDYDGVMGVPITFLDHYSPEQFEILGLAQGSDDVAGECYLGYIPTINYDGGKARPYVRGRAVYPRVLIRRKKVTKPFSFSIRQPAL